MNNRASMVHQPRQELKNLRFTEKERKPLAKLYSILHMNHTTSRKARRYRRWKKERFRKS